MIAIDTNILLRLLQIDDDPVQAARAKALVAENAPIFVDDIVLAEFAWVCARTYKMKRAAIVLRLEAIADSPEIRLADAELVQAAVEEYARLGADFADGLIARRAAASGCETTWTFDVAASKTPGFKLLKS